MKQDLELQRDILLKVEMCEELLGLPFIDLHATGLSAHPEKIKKGSVHLNKTTEYNLNLLGQREYVRVTHIGGYHYVNLTAAGHDYLDAVREDKVWKKTKQGLAAIGGGTLEIAKDLAVAYVKQSAKEKLGIDL